MKDVLRVVLAVLFVVSLVPAMAWAGAEMGQVPPKVELKDNLGAVLTANPGAAMNSKASSCALLCGPGRERHEQRNERSTGQGEIPGGEVSVRCHHQYGRDLHAQFPDFLVSQGETGEIPQDAVLADYKKVIVQQWKLADDSSDIVAFDKSGKVIFRKDGKLTPEEIQKLLKAIKDNL